MLLLLFNNPLSFLLIDESSNHRFTHLFGTLYGSYENNFIPHGFNLFTDEYLGTIMYNTFGKSLLVGSIGWEYGGRYMTGLGEIVFELGFFTLSFVYFLIKNISNKLAIISLLLILTAPTPLATPLVPIIIYYLTLKSPNNN